MYAGEGNVQLVFNVNNPNINISTWTCSMVVRRLDNNTTVTYSLTPSSDGTQATYTTTGTEFPVATAYQITFKALKPGANAPNKSVVVINVQNAD